jgi:hypothetical protein
MCIYRSFKQLFHHSFKFLVGNLTVSIKIDLLDHIKPYLFIKLLALVKHLL